MGCSECHSLPLQIAKTLENDIFLLFLILISTKSVTFAHCGLIFVDKASTDDGEQKPSSLTGGQLNLQPSTPYLQQSSHPALPEACPLCRNYPNPAAKHPNTSAEATDAASAIIRDYGITN